MGEHQRQQEGGRRNTQATTRRHVDLVALESKLGQVFAGEPFDRLNDALLNLQSMPIAGVDHAVYSHMVDGFRLAADTLVDHVRDESGPLDLLAYPILNLYRHHIELFLKQLHHLSGSFLALEPQARRNHQLVPLWEDVLERLKRIPPEVEPDPDGVVDLVVYSFSRLDESSTTFRYADLVQQSVPPHMRVNLGQLRMQVGRASKVLSDHNVWLLELLAGG